MFRLIVVPAILLVAVSAAVFALAEWHPAKQEASATPVSRLIVGDAENGKRLFLERCSMCHGAGGAGGGVGPRLVGRTVPEDRVIATIENGSGVMPGGLVDGQDRDDVVIYLDTILSSP
jgi:mono/diheme cytochrome c family protein